MWFDNVEISKSQEFEDWHPDRELPRFLWMRIVGKPGRHDFWMTSELILAVSERALDLLKKNGTTYMDVSGPLHEQSGN